MRRWSRGLGWLGGAFALALLVLVASEGTAQRRGGPHHVSRSGPAATGSIRGDRHRQRADSRRDRHGDRRDAQRDRREHRQDVHRERREFVRDERIEYYEDRYRRRHAAALSASAYRALSCARSTVVVNGVTYHRCGTTWYNRAYRGGSVTYVIVTAPPGY